MRTRIVLYAADGLGNDEITARLDTPRQVVSKWRKRFFEQRLAGLTDLPRGGRPPEFSPDVVVAVKALACELSATAGTPLARWQCPDLARSAVAQGIVASISGTTIWRWLDTDAIKPWQHRSWIFPRDPDFGAKASWTSTPAACPAARSRHAARADRRAQRTDRPPRCRVEQLLADLPAAQAPPGGTGPDGKPAYLAAADRLDEITGIGRHAAQAIIAEIGLSMAVFPTAAHLASSAKICPSAVQSGATTRAGKTCKTGKGNPYLKNALGEAAAAAGRTNTFLGARCRRLARRIGKIKALVAIARSILVIVWELLSDPTARYCDLGPDFFDNRVRPERRKHNHIRQLEALGYKVTLEPAA